MIICTLFNSLYLDKGLLLYDSLLSVTPDLRLYILAMDDKCYEVLRDLNYESIIPISLKDFENDELKYVKSCRSVGEYCWTCTPWLIEYVLNNFDAEYCTYVDADMAFYSSPSVVIEEMKKCNASVQVVEHRFNPYEAKRSERKVGKYCVEFNTFKNDADGRNLLNLWKYQCLNKCTIKEGKGRFWGDQKYLNHWVEDYTFVMSTQNIGVGIAPWNMTQYELSTENNHLVVERDGQRESLVCCHFEAITFIDDNRVNIHAVGSWNKKRDVQIIELLYKPYLGGLLKFQKMLRERYGISTIINHHPELKKASMKDRLENLKELLLYTRFISCFFMIKIPQKLFRGRNIVGLN